MTPSDPSATLQPIRDRAGVVAKLGPPRPGGDLINAAHRSAADVPRLLKVVEAVLELAAELEATPYPDAAAVTREQLPVEVARTDIARGLGRIFREAITREITGKGEPCQS